MRYRWKLTVECDGETTKVEGTSHEAQARTVGMRAITEHSDLLNDNAPFGLVMHKLSETEYSMDVSAHDYEGYAAHVAITKVVD